jgi:hypothetical protein
MMVWLGGPRRPSPWSRRPGGIYLHDPPPGYQPPKARESLKDRQREAREDWILMRVATVVLTLVVVAFVVIMLVIIATHS